MPQYLVATYHPDDYDPSTEDDAMSRNIDALYEEMEAARVRVFVGGLTPARRATSLRALAAGKVMVTDGQYIETKAHIGGFWVLDAADLDEALAWGARPPSPAGLRSKYGRSTERDRRTSSLSVACPPLVSATSHPRGHDGRSFERRGRSFPCRSPSRSRRVPPLSVRLDAGSGQAIVRVRGRPDHHEMKKAVVRV